MNWLRKAGVKNDEIYKKAKEFAVIGSRLEFARYLHTVLDSVDCSYEVYVKIIGENFDRGKNTVIGGSGFGYVKDENGEWLEIPHIGGVRIGNNVRIGDNCCVDRGTIEDTVIGDGTKIDNHVHVAHNCKIGENVIICAGVTFCGSVTVEDDVWLAPGTVIKEGVTIGKGAKTGLGAIVIKDVPPGALVYGVPAEVKK